MKLGKKFLKCGIYVLFGYVASPQLEDKVTITMDWSEELRVTASYAS